MNNLPLPPMMHCERRNLRLSVPGCVTLWQSAAAKRPEPWEGRAACMGCPIGARHAGHNVPTTAPAVEAIRMMCPRCFHPAERLIKGILCVSCYNRHLEAAKGKNAKGGRPQLLDRLHSEIVVVVEGQAERRVKRDAVVGPAEVIVSLAKLASAPMAFGRRRVAFDALIRSGRGAWARQLELAI